MKIFVTGISGLLGLNFAMQMRAKHEISGAYRAHPVALDGVRALDLDVCDAPALRRTLAQIRPDVVLHTAGFTNVEGCEDRPDLAQRMNAEAARIAAEAARRAGAALVHVSTDQLFDGMRAFVPEDAAASPLNVYARTKHEGERAVRAAHPDALVLRTNFFGWGTSARTSFSDWIIASLERREPLTMFDDAYFTPILINDLSDLIVELADRGATGVYNAVGSERLTKYAFARKTADVFGFGEARIAGKPLETFGLRAPRPRDMSLSATKIERLLGRPMPAVRPSLQRLHALRQAGWPLQLEQALASRQQA